MVVMLLESCKNCPTHEAPVHEPAAGSCRHRFQDVPAAVFENCRHGILVADPEGRLQAANGAFQKLTGYPADDIQGRDILDLVAKAHRQDLQRLLTGVRRNGRAESLVELALIRKDGQRIWVGLEILRIASETLPARLLGIVHDLTEKQLLLEKLRSRETGYRTLINASLNAAFLVDLNGTILVANERGAARLGCSPAEMIGRNFADLLPADVVRKRKEMGIKSVVEGKAVRFEDRDENGLTYEHQYFPVPDEKGAVTQLAIYSIDITDRRASEQERKRLQAQLQQAQKMEAIGTLAGGIAHDFNNLMMAIQGNASLALMNMEPTHAHYEPLKNIEKGIRKGADLTAKLLGYARKGKYEIMPVDLNRLTKEIAETFGRMRKDISIEYELSEGLRCIMADRGQLEQVLLNLFVNAADAMPGGGKLTIKTLDVTHESIPTDRYRVDPGMYVQLAVTDTGTGIPPEVRQRIFDPFFTTKKMGRGTGLGLASAYGIVKSHKGYIEVESTVGEGSTFYIYLPASDSKPQQRIEEVLHLSTGSGTLLLVDDEQNVLTVTSQLLARSGYKVIEAATGREAIEHYSRNQREIDLVILDMVMPEMGGGEVFDRIKALNPAVKVLLASGYSLEGKAREIMKRGCDGFIQKPFSLTELVDRVKSILERN
jgi:PAS domain S-box-containing protein